MIEPIANQLNRNPKNLRTMRGTILFHPLSRHDTEGRSKGQNGTAHAAAAIRRA
jgi:hypothetical protein